MYRHPADLIAAREKMDSFDPRFSTAELQRNIIAVFSVRYAFQVDVQGNILGVIIQRRADVPTNVHLLYSFVFFFLFF